MVDPDQSLLDGYIIHLPSLMARRVEDGALIFWHAPRGLTFWITASERDDPIDPSILNDWPRARSSLAQDELVERVGFRFRSPYPAPADATKES